jgi:hypothetical protein
MGQDLFIYGIPFGRELMQHARLRMHAEFRALGNELSQMLWDIC